MSGLHKYKEAVRDAAEALIEELKTGRLLHNKSALKRRSGLKIFLFNRNFFNRNFLPTAVF